MRSAGRVFRVLVVLGVLALCLPGASAASQRGPSNKKAKTELLAKKSKQKVGVNRAKMRAGGNRAKAAGSLPRPAGKGAGKGAGLAAGESGRGMLASAIAGPASRTTTTKATARARMTKAKRPVMRKAKTARRTTKRKGPAKRRAARTQRTKSRKMGQELAGQAPSAAELTAAEAAQRRAGAERELGPSDFFGSRPQEKGPGRFRRFLSATGRVIKKSAKVAGYVAIVAAPAAVMAVGGLPIAFAIAAPAIFLGIPLAIGLAEQRAKAKAGYGDGDIQDEMLQRYMSRQMLENQDLNGPGPGNGVAGVGGLNTLGNMINPGGIGGQQLP
jgi:hypothetical protein